MFKLNSSAREPVEVLVHSQVTHTMAEGLGFNWYSCYEPETYPAADDEARWGRIFDHASWLNMQFIRFGQSARELCDDAGNFKAGHRSFDQLCRVDRWAQQRGVRLILDPFGIPQPHQYEPWEGAPTVWGGGHHHLGVKDVDSYVTRFIVPYVRHAVEELGCKSVVWFNHVNEPLTGGTCATPPGIDDHARYVEVLAGIRQGLNEAGLRHVGLMGPDTNSLRYWPIPHMLEAGADPDGHIQAYCMHQYHSRFDWDQRSRSIGSNCMHRSIEEQLAVYAQYAHQRGKPFLITELGMFQYGWSVGDPAGIARHDNVLLETEFIVRALNKGTDAVLRWAWLNPGTHDGWWQLVQTADGSDQPMLHPYYGYGTLMRFIDRQAKILACQVAPAKSSGDWPGLIQSVTSGAVYGEDAPAAGGPQTVHALAIENTDGTRSLFVINDDYRDCARVVIRFPTGARTEVHKIVNDPVRKYHHEGTLEAPSGQLEHADVLSPMSLTVYTTRAVV